MDLVNLLVLGSFLLASNLDLLSHLQHLLDNLVNTGIRGCWGWVPCQVLRPSLEGDHVSAEGGDELSLQDDDCPWLLHGDPVPLLFSQISTDADQFLLAQLRLWDHYWLEDWR